MRGLKKAPAKSALSVKGGAPYLFMGNVERFGGSLVSAGIVSSDAKRKFGQASRALTTGGFSMELSPPAGAQQAVSALRIKGPACFAVHNQALTERPGLAPTATTDLAETVVMIALKDVVHDGRVLKTAKTLIDHSYSLMLRGMRHCAVGPSVHGIPNDQRPAEGAIPLGGGAGRGAEHAGEGGSAARLRSHGGVSCGWATTSI